MPTVAPARLPDPAEPVPAVAWPTVGLFGIAVGLFAGSTYLAISDQLSYWFAVPLNAIASYLFFTVLHDACHRSVSQHDFVNTWLGRLSGPMLAPPISSYGVFRFIHMQHHRFTNHDPDEDPDAWTTAGPRWSWPLRWATIDLAYMRFYAPKLISRPRREQIELAVTASVIIGVGVFAAISGEIMAYLLLYVVPSRVSLMYLAFAFDFLPHHGLDARPDEDRFRTTRNRIGRERIASAVLLYQNYHLVHHLHPLIPFYRYIAAWRRNEDEYLAHKPALSTLGGREISSDEYRSLRRLGED